MTVVFVVDGSEVAKPVVLPAGLLVLDQSFLQTAPPASEDEVRTALSATSMTKQQIQNFISTNNMTLGATNHRAVSSGNLSKASVVDTFMDHLEIIKRGVVLSHRRRNPTRDDTEDEETTSNDDGETTSNDDGEATSNDDDNIAFDKDYLKLQTSRVCPRACSASRSRSRA